MNPLVAVIASAATAAGGLWAITSGARAHRPPLARVSAALHQPVVAVTVTNRLEAFAVRFTRFGAAVSADLRLVDRSPATHGVYLAAAAIGGFLAPALLLAVGQATGLVGLPVFAPLVAGLLVGGCAPAVVQVDLGARSRRVRDDLRYQLSAFVDLFTMLLAGNHANEGAIRAAAAGGDGRLFIVLRRRIVEAAAAGRSLTAALHATGVELNLVELQEIALTASLASSRGAPISRSLTAKCATLRASLAAEEERVARVRGGKLTFPLVGMGLLLMAVCLYPFLAGNPLHP